MAYVMEHDTDPKKTILDEIGDLSQIKINQNQILVAIYLRPEKTSGGIILTNSIRDEDKWQGKVGLVLKKGPKAFVDKSGEWFTDDEVVNVNEWVFFRPSDGWGITVNGVLCRLLDDTVLRGTTPDPDLIW